MKRTFICILTALASISALHAQSEIPADTVRSKAIHEGLPLEAASPSEKNPLPDVKNFDGFLLDMGLMKTMAPPALPRFTLEIPDASKDYNRIFRLNTDATYSQGLSNVFSLSDSQYFGANPLGINSFWDNTDNLQRGSFKLKNGMRIHTYGEYDKDGWKVPNRSALPWERNNFKGAFEIKSANGSFGIRIEVQQGRKTPY